jgi:putative DNA primase/helicase
VNEAKQSGGEYTPDAIYEARIPEELRQRPQWVVHRGKIPYTPGTGKRASSTDLMTWRSFEDAMTAYKAGGYDGVGFVFSSADPYVGVDLDKCRNPETGELTSEARRIVDDLGGYAEVSPSGTGVHIIVCGKLPEKGKRRRRIEAYHQDRYFTVTGRAF